MSRQVPAGAPLIRRRPALSDAAVADPQQAKLGRWRFARWALRMQRLLDSVDEIVGLAVGAARFERHVARGAGNFAGAAGDRQHRVAGVEERPLDGDLALSKESVQKHSQALPTSVRKQMPWSEPTLFLSSASYTSLAKVRMSPAVSPLSPVSVTASVSACSTTLISCGSASTRRNQRKIVSLWKKPPADTRKSSCPRACGTGSDAEIGKLDQIPLWYLIFVRRR